MKTTKRGKLLMLACAALVAVLACLPLLWFRAQDARMFGTVNQSSGLYESREVSGDDFYLLQQVKNRTQMNRTDWMVSAGLDGTAALYTPAGNSRYNMTSSDTAADFAASLLTHPRPRATRSKSLALSRKNPRITCCNTALLSA